MLCGIIGAVLQITAITQVAAHVKDPVGNVAYAVGVGFGVLLGLVPGDRLTPRMIGVTIITQAPHLARNRWDRGWPVTAQPGRASGRGLDYQGPSGAELGTPPGPPKRSRARYGINRPLRWQRCQPPKEGGTADERILGRV